MASDIFRRSRTALVRRRPLPLARSVCLVVVGAVLAAVMAGCGGQTSPVAAPAVGWVAGSVIAYGGPWTASSKGGVHPEPGARIEVRQGNDLVATTHTGADGTFRIGVGPGTYIVGSLDGCLVHARVVVKSAATSTVHLSCGIP
jgi:hypothetical protein